MIGSRDVLPPAALRSFEMHSGHVKMFKDKVSAQQFVIIILSEDSNSHYCLFCTFFDAFHYVQVYCYYYFCCC